jgi:DNA mismatch repair protein MutS2
VPYKVGADIVIAAIEKPARVVEVLPDGRYRVLVGSVHMVCTEAELSELPEKEKRRRSSGRRAAVPASHAPPPRLAAERLDLHGLRVEEALHVVELTIDRALRAGVEVIEIVHGIGTGRVKNAVTHYLRSMPVVSRIEPDRANPGVTRVYL